MPTVEIQVDAQFQDAVDAALVERTVAAVLAAEGVADPVELSVLVTTDEALQSLNRDFRGIDAPTDVLSFGDEAEDDAAPAFVRPPGAARYLGDLAISFERVLVQASEYGHSNTRELAYLTAHGVLHLLGYDHERGPADAAEMRAREEAAMELLGLPRAAG